ncbi:hypothetical protein HMPREF1868_00499 [Olsenella sp. DNF00959]|nr:hypothetical protein HMPREF1868_00499 [Olsenella sp. DNF00959]
MTRARGARYDRRSPHLRSAPPAGRRGVRTSPCLALRSPRMPQAAPLALSHNQGPEKRFERETSA